MSDSLLRHYEKELAFIRQSADEFATRHPKIAGRLKLGAEDLEDPLVERLISAFAYLNAHVQQRLDDDFPELTDAVLGTLYPHYQRPIPAMSIAQFEPAPGLDKGHVIDAGTTLRTGRANGESCHFRTAYPVYLQPVKLHSASMRLRPFIAPGSNAVSGAGGVIHLRFDTVNAKLNIADTGIDTLRLFLRGQAQHAYPLYEQLLNNCVRVVVADSEQDSQPRYLAATNIRPVGFEPGESLLPYPDAAFPGYRLLTEFFVFPEKYLFIDITGLGDAVRQCSGSELHLYFYLDEPRAELEHQLSAKSFALGCTPIINLFPARADPILLTQNASQYRVVPDSRRVDSMEIYSIESVTGVDLDDSETPYLPLHGIHHSDIGQCHWHASRREVIEGEHHNETASEMDLTLVDLSGAAIVPGVRSLDIELLCLNRNLPAKLVFSAGQLPLEIAEGSAPTASIQCITAPTQTLRPALKNGAYWRLISHLNLNHLSLTGSDGASVLPLQEVLKLYDFRNSASTRTSIAALRNVATRTISAPITIDGRSALCRGTEIVLEMDTAMLAGGSAYLLASVLERFLAVYCSINSFVRLVARTTQREGDLKRWPPRSGDRPLL